MLYIILYDYLYINLYKYFKNHIDIIYIMIYNTITTKENTKTKSRNRNAWTTHTEPAPTKKLERMLYIIAKVKQNENYF